MCRSRDGAASETLYLIRQFMPFTINVSLYRFCRADVVGPSAPCRVALTDGGLWLFLSDLPIVALLRY
jgi:hypothetical protein